MTPAAPDVKNVESAAPRTEWGPTEAELLTGYALDLRLQEAVAP